MARNKLTFTYELKTPEDALRCRREHLSKGGLVVEAADATFGQPADIHLDMLFFGRSFVIKGMVVSATGFGTALQITSIPEDLAVFLDALEGGAGTGALEEEFSENLVALPGETTSLDGLGLSGSLEEPSGSLDEPSADQVSFSMDAGEEYSEDLATDVEVPVIEESDDDDLADNPLAPVPEELREPAPPPPDGGDGMSVASITARFSDDELETDLELPTGPGAADEADADLEPESQPRVLEPDFEFTITPQPESAPESEVVVEFSHDAALALEDIPSLEHAMDELEAELTADQEESRVAAAGTSGAWSGEIDDGQSGVTASSIFSELGELDEELSAEIRRMEREISGERPALSRKAAGGDQRSDPRIERVIEADESVVISIIDDDGDEDWADASWAQGDSLDDDDEPLPAPASALNPAFEQTLNPAGAPEWTTPVFASSPNLKGKVDGKAMNDLVRQIGSRRLTGVLRLKMLTRMLVGLYIEGQPVYFVTHPPEDGRSLEDALTGLSQVNVDTFDVALGKAERENRHLGLVLVAMGVLTLSELRKMAQGEARKVSSQLPMRRGGTYGFWEMPIPRDDDGETLDIETVLGWDISA